MVEHSAVNRVVVGSSPTRGAQSAAGAAAKKPVNIRLNSDKELITAVDDMT